MIVFGAGLAAFLAAGSAFTEGLAFAGAFLAGAAFAAGLAFLAADAGLAFAFAVFLGAVFFISEPQIIRAIIIPNGTHEGFAVNLISLIKLLQADLLEIHEKCATAGIGGEFVTECSCFHSFSCRAWNDNFYSFHNVFLIELMRSLR
jgi:hypothetical protein